MRSLGGNGHGGTAATQRGGSGGGTGAVAAAGTGGIDGAAEIAMTTELGIAAAIDTTGAPTSAGVAENTAAAEARNGGRSDTETGAGIRAGSDGVPRRGSIGNEAGVRLIEGRRSGEPKNKTHDSCR